MGESHPTRADILAGHDCMREFVGIWQSMDDEMRTTVLTDYLGMQDLILARADTPIKDSPRFFTFQTRWFAR